MRAELLPPLRENPEFLRSLDLVERIYKLIRSDQPCSEELAQLNAISRHRLMECDFAKDERDDLITPDELAFGLILHKIPTPEHLTYEEMLELVTQLKNCTYEDGLYAGYWIQCLVDCTGDTKFSYLLQGGAERYFRDGNSRWLSPKEILDIALAAGKGNQNASMKGDCDAAIND